MRRACPESGAGPQPEERWNPCTLNRAEIYFTIVQRKVLSPNDLASQDALTERLPDFQYYGESAAGPFGMEVQPPGCGQVALSEHAVGTNRGRAFRPSCPLRIW